MCLLFLLLVAKSVLVLSFGTSSGNGPHSWHITGPEPCPTHCGQSIQTMLGSVRCVNRHGGGSSKCTDPQPSGQSITCPATQDCVWATGINCKEVCGSLNDTTECDMESMRMFDRYDFYKAEETFDFECTHIGGSNFLDGSMPHFYLGECTYANPKTRSAIQCDSTLSNPQNRQRICACKMPNPTASPTVTPTIEPTMLPTPAPTGPSMAPSWAPTVHDPNCDFSSNRKALLPPTTCPDDLNNLPICKGNDRPDIDSFQVGDLCIHGGLIDWITPPMFYMYNCDFRNVFQVTCVPKEIPETCPTAPTIKIDVAQGHFGCSKCFHDAYCRYYCKCSGELLFVDDCADAQFTFFNNKKALTCIRRIGETTTPSPTLTPSFLPTSAPHRSTTLRPTPASLAEYCGFAQFQSLISELSACQGSGEPCCSNYDSVFSCPFIGQFGSEALAALKQGCLQKCTQTECHATGTRSTPHMPITTSSPQMPITTSSPQMPITTSSPQMPTTPLNTIPPIIPTIENGCGFESLLAFQKDLTDLAACFSGISSYSIAQGSECCPRYDSILTNPCRLEIGSDSVEEMRQTCSDICPNHHCQSDAIVSKSIRFKGDFNSIVAPDKARFLQECSSHFTPVKCIDARAGSIIVDLEGQSNEIDEKIDHLQAQDMQLPSYPALNLAEENASSSSIVGITLGIALPLLAAVGFGLLYYLKNHTPHLTSEEDSKPIEVIMPHRGFVDGDNQSTQEFRYTTRESVF